jgi:hypothetical protein
VVIRFTPEMTIPPKGQVSLLHVVVQRNSIETAAAFLKTLKFREFLKDIPKEEWGKIINVRPTAGLFSLDDIGIFQPQKNDAILLSSGEWLTGTFKGERLRLTTDFGERDFQRKDILCLLFSGHGTFKAVSRQGEVLTGTLQEPDLEFVLDRGDPLRIPWKHVAKLGLALPEISSPRPKPSPPIVPISTAAPTGPTLAKSGPDQPSALPQPGEEEEDNWFEFTQPIFILRNKDRVIGEPRQKEITIHTLFGTQVFPLKALAKITFPSADQPFPEIRLSDGSVLVGLMKEASFEVLLANGQNALLSFDRLQAALFQVKEVEGLEAKGPGKQSVAFLKLWNGDVLAGQFLGGQGVLDFQTPFGTQKLDAAQIKEIRFRPEVRPECRVTFWDDSAMPGHFSCPTIPFHSPLAGVFPMPLGLVELFRCPGALPPIEKRKEIEGLVEKLGHEEPAVRESTQKTLLEMGPSIQGVLQAHLPHKDPEIQKRVLKLLKNFRAGDEEGTP